MKAKRTALLGILVCLIGAAASAQIAPSNSGDIGLFTIPTADVPRAGQFTLGVYGWKDQVAAGNLRFSDTDFRSRLYSHWAGEGSLGLGLTDNWTVSVSARGGHSSGIFSAAAGNGAIYELARIIGDRAARRPTHLPCP